MSELSLVIRFEEESKVEEPTLERLEEEIAARGIGEVEVTMKALGETILFVALPEACSEIELPARMAMLQKVLDDLGLQEKGRVEIPEDADDDDEEGWVSFGDGDGEGAEDDDGDDEEDEDDDVDDDDDDE
jgi:phosphopantothenoylcysteine synthetase/decarboxylase